MYILFRKYLSSTHPLLITPKAYLAGTDSGVATRTWQQALDAIVETKSGSTQDRWRRAAKETALDSIRHRIILETQAEHLLACLTRPGISYRCGSYALARVAQELHFTNTITRQVRNLPSPEGGFKLSDLAEIAAQYDFDLIAVQRQTGGEIPVPAVIHWKLDHYAAILKRQDDFSLAKDPTFDGEQWISANTINSEASGNFLVVAGKVPEGFRELSKAEAALIHGKGCCNDMDNDEDNPGQDEGPDCPPPPPPTPGDGPGAGEGEAFTHTLAGIASCPPATCTVGQRPGVTFAITDWFHEIAQRAA